MANSEKMAVRRRPSRFELVGGALCLDFVNTLDDRSSEQPKELLKTYVDLAHFGEDSRILDAGRVDHLFALSMKSPDAAQHALKAGIQLREVMFQVFWAVVKKKPIPPGPMITLNEYVQEAAQHAKLVAVKRRFAWRFEDTPNKLEQILWPIARSAGELLSSAQLQYVRVCGSPTCQWLFLDTSKAHHRRWCDMKQCGNRAKTRAFWKRSQR